MRSITLALALLLALSAGAYAQPAANGEVAYTHPAVNVGVSAGVLLGSLTETVDDDEALSSGALGYYIAGGAALAELPIAISASYATFSPDKIKVSGEPETDDEHTASALDLLVGYRVHENIAVAAGWASASYSDVTEGPIESRSASGLAIGAMGGTHLGNGIALSGKAYFVPSATIEIDDNKHDENGSLFGLSASIGYQFMPNLGAEAGYRLSRASFEQGDDTVAFTASGFFAGVTFTF
jgi:hypothetical protein